MSLLLSIITVNLNNASGLQKTIKSVVEQDIDQVEFIVIDGNSNDGSLLLLQQYQNNIAYWVSEIDEGIFHAMNKGLAWAKGQYCLFLNSGDWLVDNCLTELKLFLQSRSEDILYGNTYLHYESGLYQPHTYPNKLSMRFFFRATIGHQSTFTKTQVLKNYGGYDTKLKVHGDYDFWLKSIVNDNCSYFHIPVFVSYYDMSGISANLTKESLAEHQMVIERYLTPLVLADYMVWQHEESTLEIMKWYQRQPVLFFALTYFYKALNKVFKLMQ